MGSKTEKIVNLTLQMIISLTIKLYRFNIYIMILINIYMYMFIGICFQFEIKIPFVSCSLLSKKIIKNIPKIFGHPEARGRTTPIFGNN